MAAEYDLPTRAAIQKSGDMQYIWHPAKKVRKITAGVARLSSIEKGKLFLFRWLNNVEYRFCVHPGTNMRMRSIKMLASEKSTYRKKGINNGNIGKRTSESTE